MIKYNFGISINGPYINIDTYPDLLWSDEINLFSSGDSVRNLVKELKEVVEGKRDDCSFGFETTLICCYKVGFKNEHIEYKEGKVIILYDYYDETLETDLKPEEIYKMMKEWKEYIEKWEKETGKKFGE